MPTELSPLAVIETNCQDLSELRAKMRRKLEVRKKEQDALDAKYNPELREIQEKCNVTRAALMANLEVGRELFKSPKMREFFGIKVGFKKERDTLLMPDDKLLVERIEKMLSAKQAEAILDRSATVIKNAFKKLPAADLQKLGCSTVTGADTPVVIAQDDDIEELVKKAIGEPIEAAVTE